MKGLTSTSVRTALFTLTTAALIGCGGGGGGGAVQDSVQLSLLRGGEPAAARWVAYKDGDTSASWKKLEPSGDGKYTFRSTDPAGRFGIAVVTMESGRPQVRILHATRAEGTQWCMPGSDPIGYSMPCMPVGLPKDSTWTASMFDRSDLFTGPLMGTLSPVPGGTRDLLAGLFARPGDPCAAKLVVDRNVSVSGSEPMNIDFAGAKALTPETHMVAASPSDRAIVEVFLTTAHGATMRTSCVVGRGPYAALPRANQDGGDVYQAVASESTTGGFRSAMTVFQDATNKTLELPQAFRMPTVTRDGLNPHQLKAVWQAYGNARLYELQLKSWQAVGSSRAIGDPAEWNVVISPAWLMMRTDNSAGSNTFSTPDLSGLPGWNATWSFDALAPVEWSVGAYRSGGSLPECIRAIHRQASRDGDSIYFSSARGVFAP